MQNVFKFQQKKCGEMYLHLKSIATFTTNNFKNQLIVTVFLPTVTSVFKKNKKLYIKIDFSCCDNKK